MKLTLKIWRQENAKAKGAMKTYQIDGIEGDMSFLEMLDVLNEELINKGESLITIVAKASVEVVLCRSMGSLMGQTV